MLLSPRADGYASRPSPQILDIANIYLAGIGLVMDSCRTRAQAKRQVTRLI